MLGKLELQTSSDLPETRPVCAWRCAGRIQQRYGPSVSLLVLACKRRGNLARGVFLRYLDGCMWLGAAVIE